VLVQPDVCPGLLKHDCIFTAYVATKHPVHLL
jgi:hypothetical protein